MGTALPPRVGPGDPWGRAGGVSPGRDVGGEGGALVGVHELGGPRDVFPLGLVCPSCDSSRKGLGDRLQRPTRDVHSWLWPREHTSPSAPPLGAALLWGQRALRGRGSSTQTQLLIPARSPSLPSSVSSRLPRCAWKELPPRRQGRAGAPLTNDAAEQPQAGGVSLPAVPRVIRPGGREWDPKPDGAVELAAPRLHGDNGAERGLVAQEFGDQLIGYRLGLRSAQGVHSAPEQQRGSWTEEESGCPGRCEGSRGWGPAPADGQPGSPL